VAIQVQLVLLLAAAALQAAAAAEPRLGVAAVQAAYEDARLVNAERHAYDLVIETAKCQPMDRGGQLCQIDFTRRGESDRRLYFDVITLDEHAGRWVLLSGLCMKKPPPPMR
jgi:hypothetical protein